MLPNEPTTRPLSDSEAGDAGTRGIDTKTAATRLEILDAAFEVFTSTGFTRGWLMDTATRAGLTLAGLLHHFPSEASLLQALIDQRDEHQAGQESMALLKDLIIKDDLSELMIQMRPRQTDPIPHSGGAPAPGMVEVLVPDDSDPEAALENAIGIVTAAAARYGTGIMITQIAAGRYVLRAHPHVPLGLTRQRD